MALPEPIDPTTLTLHQFASRVHVILHSEPEDDPLPPSRWRCIVCRRVFRDNADKSLEELNSDHEKRFGYRIPMEHIVIICDDCTYMSNRISRILRSR